MYNDIFSNGLAMNEAEPFSDSNSKDDMFDLLCLQTLNKQNKKKEEKARKEEQARKEREAKRNSSTFFCMSFKNAADKYNYLLASDEEREAIKRKQMEERGIIQKAEEVVETVKENLDALNNCNDFPVAGRKNLEKASTSNQRILSMSKLISKAGRIIDDNDAAKIVELSGFLSEYVTNVLSCIYDEHDIVIKCIGDLDSDFTLTIKPLSFIMLVDNLVGNAIKANATILDIIIDDSAPNVYSVVFKDNGSGISKDISDVKRLFEFGVTTTNGSGLGLFYAKKHITELKGFISIRENEEQGVSVTLSWKK